MGPVRIAIVGMGGFARTYLRDIEQVEGLDRHVAQVAIEADQRNFSTEVRALGDKGIRVFASLRQMLAACRNEIGLLCIPTGIPLHRVMMVAGLGADWPRLGRKTAAGSIQDVDAMLAAQVRSGRICAVGYQHVGQQNYQFVKHWICAGNLGRVRSIKGFGCWPRDPEYYGRNGWAGNLAAGDTWVLDSRTITRWPMRSIRCVFWVVSRSARRLNRRRCKLSCIGSMRSSLRTRPYSGSRLQRRRCLFRSDPLQRRKS